MTDTSEIFMNRALELAKLGKGQVSPNPMVGCVIVYKEKIVGEGWHQRYGEAHAEVNAINSVKDQGLLSDSTLYVSLEPCSHVGKTPPCANLIIEKKIPKVIIGCLDPHQKVSGKGVERLKEAGVEVQTGVIGKKCEEFNKRFFTSHTKRRPYVILKWAETSDGFVARKNYDSKWISGKTSRQLVHKWRSEEDAILVGFNTAKYDNPNLTVRDWQGKNPTRLLLDRDLQISNTSHLFDSSANTIIFNSSISKKGSGISYEKIDFSMCLPEILSALHAKDINSVIVEGGASTLNQFIGANLWDEARIFKSPNAFREDGIKAPKVDGILKSTESIGDDKLFILMPHKSD